MTFEFGQRAGAVAGATASSRPARLRYRPEKQNTSLGVPTPLPSLIDMKLVEETYTCLIEEGPGPPAHHVNAQENPLETMMARLFTRSWHVHCVQGSKKWQACCQLEETTMKLKPLFAVFALVACLPAQAALVTNPDDPRVWQGASVGTFAQLYYGSNTLANRQLVVDNKLLDDSYFSATGFSAATLIRP